MYTFLHAFLVRAAVTALLLAPFAAMATMVAMPRDRDASFKVSDGCPIAGISCRSPGVAPAFISR